MTSNISSHWSSFHDVLHRIPSSPHPELNSLYHPNDKDDRSLVDIYPSPSSSASSDVDYSAAWSLNDSFLATSSRVLLLRISRPASLSSLFSLFSNSGRNALPVSMWTLRSDSRVEPDLVWAVFVSHHDAVAALTLFHPFISLSPALHTDLDPLDIFRQLDPLALMHSYSSSSHHLRMSFSTPDLQKRAQSGFPRLINGAIASQNDDFVISSNPPNPRTTFRLGDWICNAPNCAAHNFGRNLACRGCGCPRAEYPLPSIQSCVAQSARLPSSPRFAGFPPTQTPNQPFSLPSPISTIGTNSTSNSASRSPVQPTVGSTGKSPSPTQPLLTPSGRAFSVGGKVQNVSSDPYSPCVMYWPDNELFPEQGQIRPVGVVADPQPPILNTGNRGPIEHQPGDWVCHKCSYLNWRRRKVCQTCFPYAEGNGDSISAAVQAERISLLTSLLAQNQTLPSIGLPPNLPSNIPSMNTDTIPSTTRVPRSHSTTPPQRPRLFHDVLAQPPPYRSRSHVNLGAQYMESQFIYETSGPPKAASMSASAVRNGPRGYAPTSYDESASFLPAFLQDIVQSPTLSPTSTSSADLSIEEYELDSLTSPTYPSPPRYPPKPILGDPCAMLPVGGGSSIWRLNGEESKGLSGIALPNCEELLGRLGESRRSSREGFGYLVVP